MKLVKKSIAFLLPFLLSVPSFFLGSFVSNAYIQGVVCRHDATWICAEGFFSEQLRITGVISVLLNLVFSLLAAHFLKLKAPWLYGYLGLIHFLCMFLMVVFFGL